ncbi:M4 family metallopeptidase [Wenjunlia vitaminophila]
MLAVGLSSGPAGANADPSASQKVIEQARSGKMPVKLSPTERGALLQAAANARAETAAAIGLGSQERLLPTEVIKDQDGSVHTRYERTFAGLPVLGGDLTVHQGADGDIASTTWATRATITVPSTQATVPASRASAAAVAKAKADDVTKAAITGTPRLVVWAGSGTPTLAWESVVGGLQHDGTPNELHVISDARTGAELYSYQAVMNGTGNSMYSGTVTIGTSGSYQMNDTSRGGHKTYNLNGGTSGTGTLFTDADDVWGNGTYTDPQTAGVDAHYGAQLTWDYYKTVHGRNGIRNDGVGAYSRTHYYTNYVNAFWQDSCFCMTYGDGQNNRKPLTSIDVAAHEMTHGVTSNTARLVYSGESGGLNEGTSDIFAAAVEFWANNPSDKGDYLVGEKIDIYGTGKPLRYMDQPSKDGSSKDYWYSGIGNIDVHYSSGVANHFFYLLSEGSGTKTVNGVTYNSPTYDGLPVPGIGRQNAEKIWYLALTKYMQSTTNYAGARKATLDAATELFGLGSATYNTVANTWAAVNVGSRVS